MSYFQSIVYSNSFDLIAISETWLSDYYNDNEILPCNYVVYRKDRSSHGGGVLIAVSPSNQINSTLFSSVEFLAVNISVKPSLLFCCVYNPPNSSSADVFNLSQAILSISDHQNIVLVGDFNFAEIDWSLISSPPTLIPFCDVICDCNFVQLVDFPTHIRGNTLDLIFSNNPDSVANIVSSVSTHSDHHLLTFTINSSPPVVSSPPMIEIFDYAKGDLENLSDFVLNIDFSSCFNSIDTDVIWSSFYSLLLDACHLNLYVKVINNIQYGSLLLFVTFLISATSLFDRLIGPVHCRVIT